MFGLIQKYRKQMLFSTVLLALILGYMNCSDVKLKGNESPSTLPTVTAVQPPVADTGKTPTVTEAQCDAYFAANPTFIMGQEPTIYFMCDKLLFDSTAAFKTRELNFKVSPETTIDFSHHTQVTMLQSRINRAETAVQGLTSYWWTSPGAPSLETNPAEPLSRLVTTPSTNSTFTVYFQYLKGTDVGLVHKINFQVVNAGVPQSTQTFNCPGFTSTITINPYTDLISDTYFTGSHGFIDNKTAIVMKVPVTANILNGRINIYNPYLDPWTYITNISTRPCDFETNIGTSFQGSNEFGFYSTPYMQDTSGNAIPSYSVTSNRKSIRLNPGKDFFLNMKVPDCSLTIDGLSQRNCFALVELIKNGTVVNSTDEFRGVYIKNGVSTPPLFPSWSGIPGSRPK